MYHASMHDTLLGLREGSCLPWQTKNFTTPNSCANIKTNETDSGLVS